MSARWPLADARGGPEPTAPAAPAPRRCFGRAARIAAGYAVFAALWIYASDAALELLAPDAATMARWSVAKGVAFVGLTSVLLFLVMRKAWGATEAGYLALQRNQAQIERFNRLLAALGQVGHAVVGTSSRDELLARTCAALVRDGGLRSAWIGWHDGAGLLRQVAAAGDAAAGATDLPLDDGPGPAAQAFRENGPQARNASAGEATGAAAAFPLRQQGRCVGVLLVQAGEPGFFQPREMSLLGEAAHDVSFALDALAREAERAAAQAVAERERSFSQTVLESMPGILYLYDDQRRFRRWNRTFEQVSGYTQDEVARMNPLDFFPPEHRPQVEERIAEVFATGESSVEAHFLTRDGRRLPYFLTGRRVQLDGMTCLVGVGIDISQRLRAERALREVNETLELRVQERTRALSEAVARAEAADEIKSAFLATMSHELRTPLNSIIGFSGILLQGLAGPLLPEQAKQLGMVRNSSRHLLELINDVLDLSKIEAGQLKVERAPFDLPAVVERACASLRPAAQKKGLALQAQVDPALGTVTGDRRRVEQILLNLLNNAVKFTEQGGVTLIADTVQEPGGPAVRLRVRDTGMGIRAEHLPSLFLPFRQLDHGLAREHEGTGLGLAICQRLAALMDGRIEAASTWGEGSQFTVTLPLPGSAA